jgi:hypothetical protein
MLISLYNYDYYMTNYETLLTYENKGIDFSDIHSYSQGKYLSSMFSENKPDQNDK